METNNLPCRRPTPPSADELEIARLRAALLEITKETGYATIENCARAFRIAQAALEKCGAA